jgi:hypothetical protein
MDNDKSSNLETKEDLDFFEHFSDSIYFQTF